MNAGISIESSPRFPLSSDIANEGYRRRTFRAPFGNSTSRRATTTPENSSPCEISMRSSLKASSQRARTFPRKVIGPRAYTRNVSKFTFPRTSAEPSTLKRPDEVIPSKFRVKSPSCTQSDMGCIRPKKRRFPDLTFRASGGFAIEISRISSWRNPSYISLRRS